MICLSLPPPTAPPSLKPNPNFRRKNSSTRPHNNAVISFESLKSQLIRHADSGRVGEAISTLDLMSRADLVPDLTAYSVLLRSCIRTRNFEMGRAVHSKLTESGLNLDTIVLNSLISLYSKCGDWRNAEKIFASMGGLRDFVSWSAMISCYAHNNLNSRAISMFLDMLEFGERPNEFCYSAAIRACSNWEYAEIGLMIFGFLMKTGHFDSDVCVGCALIDLFAKGFGDLESAIKVFDKMPLRNSISWTLMITRFTQMGSPRDSILLFLDMIVAGFVPDRFTLSSCLSACSELGLFPVGRQLHTWVLKNGFLSDVCVGCSLVDMYAKCTVNGSMDDSRKAFDLMQAHNIMSWTAIITGYVQNGCVDYEVIELYCRMITEGGVKPNHFTIASMLKACGILFNPELGEQIYGHAVKLGLSPVNCVGNSLISMYSKCDRMEEARKAFEFLFEKNLVSYNTLVDGYARNSDSDGAFELFNEIEKNSGIEVDAFTFASLLSGAASIGAIGKGEQIHARLIKSGFESNLCICNALIAMYTKCGNIEAGYRIFNEMGDRNVISWTSIITGFAKYGFAEKALDLFEQMLVGPNEVTYVSVLSACSHAGLVDEGFRYFNSMQRQHGIRPRMEHYACMVDILGRSGRLDEAVKFIDSMPFAANALVWRTLLGSCRIHNDAELGRKAAEMIIEQDPLDPAAHVLLSNLYASAGRWDQAAKIRKGMKERNLIKEGGCSWIEIANKVHKFYVGDTMHPEAKEIYEELDRLWVEIKKIGYVADTSLVLHEVEEKEKEKYLFQHSEKIALAYGLIRGGETKKIRIFKNLRICGDCHNTMKYASVVSGREIVVRDSNRFHCFKDGACSCNDYW